MPPSWSNTLKVKVATPSKSSAGVNTSVPRSSYRIGYCFCTGFGGKPHSSHVSLPWAASGKAAIHMSLKVSPVSTSSKAKSDAEKTRLVFGGVFLVKSAEVGGMLARVSRLGVTTQSLKPSAFCALIRMV